MDSELEKRFATQEQKIDAVFKSVERIRKYMYWTFVLTLVFFVLPLIALIFVIPAFMGSLGSSVNF